MDVLRHVGVFPLLALLIPAHHYQQGGESERQGEDRNFHLSFIRIKHPRCCPSDLILTLLSVANSAFWMRIVEKTLRIPANRDLLQPITDHSCKTFSKLTPRKQKLPRKHRQWRGGCCIPRDHGRWTGDGRSLTRKVVCYD